VPPGGGGGQPGPGGGGKPGGNPCSPGTAGIGGRAPLGMPAVGAPGGKLGQAYGGTSGGLICGGAPATTGGNVRGGAKGPAGDNGGLSFLRPSDMDSTETMVGLILDTSVFGVTSISFPDAGSTMAKRLLGVCTGLSLFSSINLPVSGSVMGNLLLGVLSGGCDAVAGAPLEDDNSASFSISNAGGGAARCLPGEDVSDGGDGEATAEEASSTLPGPPLAVGAALAQGFQTSFPAPPFSLPRFFRPFPEADAAGEGGIWLPAAEAPDGVGGTEPARGVRVPTVAEGVSGSSKSKSCNPKSALLTHERRSRSHGTSDSPSNLIAELNVKSNSLFKTPEALCAASAASIWGICVSSHCKRRRATPFSRSFAWSKVYFNPISASLTCKRCCKSRIWSRNAWPSSAAAAAKSIALL